MLILGTIKQRTLVLAVEITDSDVRSTGQTETPRLTWGKYNAYMFNFTLLTYSTVQSPWAANWFAASQEIPRISRNPKVHYRTHNRPPTVSILGQPNPVRITT